MESESSQTPTSPQSRASNRSFRSLKSGELSAELESYLHEMCETIPPPQFSFGSRFTQILRTLFFKLGFGWETPVVSEKVRSFHDIVAHLLVDEEERRLISIFPDLAVVREQSTTSMAFPFELLEGRCVLVVNTASK
mmetsp:Transcript_52922/g.113457  ORF Transcript_52922/g.113457 Transcript_52922/m.113457 type:complete len:137 (+) Transcript_52922:139-549(+)